MYCGLTDAQLALQSEIQAYYAQLITPDLREPLREHAATQTYKDVIRQMGRDGWLAVGWPKEHGGRGYGPVEQLIYVRETLRAGAPMPFVTLGTVGPALMAHGTAEQKRTFLPGIAKGRTHFAIAYTEPNSGTDLASLRTTAVRDGDDYVINGSKLYTSHAEGADYIWLAARTDPKAAKHKGISLFIIDTKSPGFSLTPLNTFFGMRTNVTYYADVRVPVSMVVGEVDAGWRVITSQLNHERIGIAARGIYGEEMYRQVLLWSRQPDAEGNCPIDVPSVRRLLANVYVQLEALRILNYRLAWSLRDSEPGPALPSAAKVQGVETLVSVFRDLLQVVGLGGLVKRGSEASRLSGELEMNYRRCQLNTYGGGSGEVMREMVARFGLGMPRVQR